MNLEQQIHDVVQSMNSEQAFALELLDDIMNEHSDRTVRDFRAAIEEALIARQDNERKTEIPM